MSIIDRARIELEAINFGKEDTEAMIGLLRKFFDQWDSGGAVAAVTPVLVRLIKGQPLSPLTGDESEWYAPMDGVPMLQNKRCSSVFKDWRAEDGNLSAKAGEGKLTIHDLDNPAWNGDFPYDPETRLPAMPVMTVG